jgi:hypothetical protein
MAKTKNYLNKKDLLEEIYKSREQDELTRKCLDMLMLLAQKTIRKLYYKCEDDKQHALSEAYFDLAKNWRKFDPNFAKYHGYADLKPGDEIRVNPERGSDRTAAATVVENYPVEHLIEAEQKRLLSLGKRELTFEHIEEDNLVIFSFLKKGVRKVKKGDNPIEDFDSSTIDVTGTNRIKLDYIVKKNSRATAIFDKDQIIIKDPNPFSFFTSSCINGYAKGWKKLYPKKSKGLLLSIDSGYNTDGDGMHSL